MTKFPKSLTVLATAAALVAGVAFAQTSDPAQQPAPNTTGQPGATLGAQESGTMNSGSTLNNSGTVNSGSSVDGTTNAQSDIVSPEPRADRN
ncbi:MAG: hypothetical protein V4757_17750 [Pseudomonadota bacterium]